MLERFEAQECFSPATVTTLSHSTANLTISSTPNFISYDILLIRLLTGKLNIYCNKDGSLLKQRKNYYIFPATNEKLKSDLGSYFNCNNLELSSQIDPGNNRNTYKELYFEFCSYFFSTKKKQFETAFIHIYRILERISYALPLIWASTQRDYNNTFVQLKKFFSGTDAKEINALKIFSKSILDPTVLNTTSDINIHSVDSDWAKAHYQSIISILGNNISSSIPHHTISFKNEYMIDLISNIRNRYFHALTGQDKNFKSNQLVCPNEFFSHINEICINWLAFLVLEVLKIDLRL